MKDEDKINKKLLELKQALNVIEEIEERVSWASDFASFTSITRILDPVYDCASNAREKLQEELDDIEQQIENYNYKLEIFEEENPIEYERDNY